MEWASSEVVAEAVQGWSDGQIFCRSNGHAWRGFNAVHRPGFYEVVQRCIRCGTQRSQTWNEQGYPLSGWHPRYADGYLLKGKGRVGADGKAVLRLSTLLFIPVTEVEDA